MLASGEVGVLPINSTSDNLQQHKSKSKRTRSSNALRASEPPRSDRMSKASTTSSGTITSSSNVSRYSQKPRTNSTPNIPLGNSQSSSESNSNPFSDNYRDSVASIKDDPFFRNYQTPQSVLLAKELRLASRPSNSKDDAELDNPPTWINKRSAPASQATASVCLIISKQCNTENTNDVHPIQ